MRGPLVIYRSMEKFTLSVNIWFPQLQFVSSIKS